MSTINPVSATGKGNNTDATVPHRYSAPEQYFSTLRCLIVVEIVQDTRKNNFVYSKKGDHNDESDS